MTNQPCSVDKRLLLDGVMLVKKYAQSVRVSIPVWKNKSVTYLIINQRPEFQLPSTSKSSPSGEKSSFKALFGKLKQKSNGPKIPRSASAVPASVPFHIHGIHQAVYKC